MTFHHLFPVRAPWVVPFRDDRVVLPFLCLLFLLFLELVVFLS